MINEIVLTEDQAKPFRAQMKTTVCDDRRHKKHIPLDKQPIKGYPHSGGWKVPGVAGDPDEDGLYWLYITCPRCGYEWSLWKLGVSRSYDPTAEAPRETWKCNRCGRLHEGPPTFCGGCGNDQFTKVQQGQANASGKT